MQDSFFQNIASGVRASQMYMWGMALVLLAMTIGLGYFTEQGDVLLHFSLATVWFAVYSFINIWIVEPKHIWLFVGIGIVLRLVLLPSFPQLSDDIYRFIWDGYLLNAGVSPFEQLPSDYAAQNFPIAGLNAALFAELNSPDYYTIYPPIAQLTFYLGTLISPDSWLGAAIIMRLFIIAAEIGSLYLIIKLLAHFDYSLKNVLLYALNPLIIIELTGNLHFEAVMIFFLLAAIYLLVKGKTWLSATAMAFSVASKLLPLLFFPLLISRLGLDKAIKYFVIAGVAIVLLFLPITGNFFINHFGESLDLYFRKFEFNASVYYLARWFGYEYVGYNIINIVGPILAACTFLGIMAYALFERKPRYKNMATGMLFAICLYLLFTTTVHPWYVALPVVLCLFTRFRFPIYWSVIIWLTYANYAGEVYEEKLDLVAFEYITVVLYALWEIFISKGKNKSVYETVQ